MDGIGFVSTRDDPYVFIDLDHVVDDSGIIEPWAQDLVAEMDTYAERSQSGKGIHIIARGKKPGPRCRAPKVNSKFEMYEHGRFLVCTGNVLPNSPTTVNASQQAIDKIYSQIFGDKPANPTPKAPPRNNHTINISDTELLEKAKSASNGDKFTRLWNGDTSDSSGDHSSADLALCCQLSFWTDNDPARIDSLFRASGLMRPKWDQYRGTQTYGQMTIAKAIAGCNETYSSPKQSVAATPVIASTNGLSAAAASTIPKPVVYSDLYNAELFFATYGQDVHFCEDDDRWYHWTGEIWKRDEIGTLKQMMLGVIRSLYDILPTLGRDEAGAMLRHIKCSESSKSIAGALELVKLLDGITIRADILDSNPWLLTASNGTIDLQTGKLQPFNRDDYITIKLAPMYDPNAKCPRFKQYLDEVLPGDPDTQTFLQRLAGYLVTGKSNLRNCFMLYGKSGTGKSIFVETLASILGEHASPILKSALVQNPHGGSNDRTAVAALWQKRMVTVSEFGSGEHLDEDLLKSLTGSDTLAVRHLYGRQFAAKPRFKMLFATNFIPKFKSVGSDMRDRLRMIPFNQTFYHSYENKSPVRDDELGAKLQLEASGILAWIIRGCLIYQKNGIPESATIKTCTDTCFEEQDPLNEFLEACCALDTNSTTLLQDLWIELIHYCTELDLRMPFADSRRLKTGLQNREGITFGKNRVNAVTVTGLRLTNPHERRVF
jgi:putative DNA primase/helicase